MAKITLYFYSFFYIMGDSRWIKEITQRLLTLPDILQGILKIHKIIVAFYILGEISYFPVICLNNSRGR